MTDKATQAEIREDFLTLLSEAAEFTEDPDGDMTETGHMIDLTTFKLVVSLSSLEEFCLSLGIRWEIAARMAGISLKQVLEREWTK